MQHIVITDMLRAAIDTNTGGASVDPATGEVFMSLLRFIYSKDLMFVRTEEQASVLWHALRNDPKMFLMFNDVVITFTLMLRLSSGTADQGEQMGAFMTRVTETTAKLGIGAKSPVIDEQFSLSMQKTKMEWTDEHPWFNVMLAWRYLIPMHDFKVATAATSTTGKSA